MVAAIARAASATINPRAAIGSCAVISARRGGQFGGVEKTVAVPVLALEPGGQALAMRLQRNLSAPAARQFARREDAIAVAIHARERIAHPCLVFGQRDALVPVRVHALQVI